MVEVTLAITVAASAWMSGSASRASAYLFGLGSGIGGARVRARVRVGSAVGASAYMGLSPPWRSILRWLAAWLESSESARAAWKATSSSAGLPYLSVSAAERALVSEWSQSSRGGGSIPIASVAMVVLSMLSKATVSTAIGSSAAMASGAPSRAAAAADRRAPRRPRPRPRRRPRCPRARERGTRAHGSLPAAARGHPPCAVELGLGLG